MANVSGTLDLQAQPERLEHVRLVVGDEDAGAENWHFTGPFKKMTFAARMQHKIYWGPMKKPVEWSLKTVLAPWAYIASVVYHDSFWYPMNAERQIRQVLDSPWGRLFEDWERRLSRFRPDSELARIRGAFVRLLLGHAHELVALIDSEIARSPLAQLAVFTFSTRVFTSAGTLSEIDTRSMAPSFTPHHTLPVCQVPSRASLVALM